MKHFNYKTMALAGAITPVLATGALAQADNTAGAGVITAAITSLGQLNTNVGLLIVGLIAVTLTIFAFRILRRLVR